MPRYERTENTSWRNAKPATDLNEVLYVLAEKNSSTTPVHLFRHPEDKDWNWEIKIPWYRDGDSGGDSSGVDFYQIEEETALKLIKERLVEKRRIPQWGYTETRNREYVISSHGKRQLGEYHEQMREKAWALLKPGVHTDLTGARDIALCPSRKHYGDDMRLFFVCNVPNGSRVHVYPEDGSIVPEEES